MTNNLNHAGERVQGPNRRTVVGAAAWSVPVIAAAVAAPSAAASATEENVSISSSCYGINLLGFGQSFPQFHISAEGAPIEPGSTFILKGGGLGNLTFGGYGDFLQFSILSDSTAEITVKKPITDSLTVQVTGVAAALALTNFTLSTGTIIGNANSRGDDDAATQRLTGVGILGVFVGHCS